jgi:hypothetical protein
MASLRRILNDISVSDDVIKQRNDRKHGSRIHEYALRYSEPFIRQIPYIKDAKEHLNHRFGFSPVSCLYYGSFFCGELSETAYDKLSRNDNYRTPAREIVSYLDKANKRNADKKFIRKRIHQLSEISDKMIFSCNITVEEIRRACNAENYKRGNIAPRLVHKKDHSKDRYQKKPENRDLIWQIHIQYPPVGSAKP